MDEMDDGLVEMSGTYIHVKREAGSEGARYRIFLLLRADGGCL